MAPNKDNTIAEKSFVDVSKAQENKENQNPEEADLVKIQLLVQLEMEHQKLKLELGEEKERSKSSDFKLRDQEDSQKMEINVLCEQRERELAPSINEAKKRLEKVTAENDECKKNKLIKKIDQKANKLNIKYEAAVMEHKKGMLEIQKLTRNAKQNKNEERLARDELKKKSNIVECWQATLNNLNNVSQTLTNTLAQQSARSFEIINKIENKNEKEKKRSSDDQNAECPKKKRQ